MVKSRRRDASSSESDGSPTTTMPRCPGPALESRRGSETSTAPAGSFEAAQLEHGEGLAHGVHGAEGGEHVADRVRGQAEHLEVEVLRRPPEQRVAHRAADDERPPAARGQGVDHAPQRRRDRDVHAEMVPKPLTGRGGGSIVERGRSSSPSGPEASWRNEAAARTTPRATEVVGGGPGTAPPPRTAVAAEAMRTGVVPLATASRTDSGNRGDARLKAGDIDNDAMGNATVGDEAPGGSVITPDQDRVDDIGRALGVQEADSGGLRTTGELLDERDRKRAQQDVPDPTTRD